MRRFLALVLIFALFLPLDSCEPTDVREIPLQDTPFFSMAFDGGYTMTATLREEENWTAEPVDDGQPTEYALMTRERHTFVIKKNGERQGKLALTFFTDPTAGTIYFAENSSPADIQLKVEKAGVTAPLTLRKITYGTAEEPSPQTVSASGVDSETSLYIEGDGVYVKAGRVAELKSEGSSVYRVGDAGQGTSFSVDDGGFSMAVELKPSAGGCKCPRTAHSAPHSLSTGTPTTAR